MVVVLGLYIHLEVIASVRVRAIYTVYLRRAWIGLDLFVFELAYAYRRAYKATYHETIRSES